MKVPPRIPHQVLVPCCRWNWMAGVDARLVVDAVMFDADGAIVAIWGPNGALDRSTAIALLHIDAVPFCIGNAARTSAHLLHRAGGHLHRSGRCATPTAEGQRGGRWSRCGRSASSDPIGGAA